EKIEAEEYAAALVFFDDLVRLAPDFAEGWNQRATAYFLQGDYGRSMRDIEVVLTLEPRHFGALSGLGIILDRTGNADGAVAAYRRALELHPNLEGAQRGVDRLREQVDGQEL
ncbi:MAG: tetratricopeptide repeat protein, partial [Pseudomonadota bacterium]